MTSPAIPLVPPPGDNQIVLRLSHAANTDVVTASFDLLNGGRGDAIADLRTGRPASSADESLDAGSGHRLAPADAAERRLRHPERRSRRRVALLAQQRRGQRAGAGAGRARHRYVHRHGDRRARRIRHANRFGRRRRQQRRAGDQQRQHELRQRNGRFLAAHWRPDHRVRRGPRRDAALDGGSVGAAAGSRGSWRLPASSATSPITTSRSIS